MSKLWVADASPLILLEKIGQLNLLIALCDKLVIPKGVIDELLKKDNEVIWQMFFSSSNKITILKEILPKIIKRLKGSFITTKRL